MTAQSRHFPRFLKEIRAKAGAPIWRRDDETGETYVLKLTAAGAKAIVVDETKPSQGKTKQRPDHPPRRLIPDFADSVFCGSKTGASCAFHSAETPQPFVRREFGCERVPHAVRPARIASTVCITLRSSARPGP